MKIYRKRGGKKKKTNDQREMGSIKCSYHAWTVRCNMRERNKEEQDVADGPYRCGTLLKGTAEKRLATTAMGITDKCFLDCFCDSGALAALSPDSFWEGFAYKALWTSQILSQVLKLRKKERSQTLWA